MSILRRERRQWQPEPFVPPLPGVSLWGRRATPTAGDALQSSAVWACVRLICSTVAMMPVSLYTMRNDTRVPLPLPTLLRSPQTDATMPDWIYMVMASLLLRGNAYGRITARDSNLYPTAIDLISPDDVQPVRDPQTSRVVYYVNGAAIPAVDLFHVRAYRMPGYDLGLSPIQYAAMTINRDNAIQQFALGYFNDAPNPKSLLTSDQIITDPQAATIKQRVKAAVTGRDLLVLGNGVTYKPLAVSPEESQFLATQKYGAAEICRFFGVPPQKVAAADVGSSMTYASVEMSSIDLLTYTIQWWLSLLEAALAPCFPGQQHVRFDTSVLLRTDLETRMKATAIGIASKQLTPDEARAMGDLPPLTEEQLKILSLVPLEVLPTGLPKMLPVAATEQNPSLAAAPTGESNG